MLIKHRQIVRGALLFAAAFVPASLGAPARAATPFYMGGDVSLLPFIESRGGTFRDGGAVQPADHILVDRGANLFRIRLFVNPNTNYSATSGAIQDLTYSIALAQRLKASGAKVLLDLHYSDTWADPGHQAKPAAWSTLSYSALQTQVRDYTRQTLNAFDAAGAAPDMVQIGNETTNGMLYSSGKVVYTGSAATQNASWASFGGLLNAGISGVHDADATTGRHTQIALHIDGGDVQGRAQYVFNQLTTVGGVSPSSYDIAGLSFYPTTAAGLTNLQANMNYAAITLGRQVMVLEANAPWKGAAPASGYAATPDGQKAFLLAVRDAVRAVPNGKGLGAIWWYPESIQVPGTNIYDGGANALFDDSGGDALPAIDAFDTAAPTWSADADGSWASNSSWTLNVPDGPGQAARFEMATTAARTVTLAGARTVGSIRFRSPFNYTLAGNDSLTLSNPGSPSRIDVLAGHHVIAAPVILVGDAEFNAAWGARLTLSEPVISVGTPTVTKLGSGIVDISQAHVSAIDVETGTLRLTPNASFDASVAVLTSALTIRPTATLDLTSSSLVIDLPSNGDAAPILGDVRTWLARGAITSSTPSANETIGYASGPFATSRLAFDGTPIDSTSVLLQRTVIADATLDGVVNFDDLLALARSYGLSGGATWQNGDSNYDGVVNFDDLLALARHYGSADAQSLPADVAAGVLGDVGSDWELAQALVPEPSLPLAIVLASTALMRLRRARSARAHGDWPRIDRLVKGLP